jgi:glycine betaine/proline transport system ATP-binding protein
MNPKIRIENVVKIYGRTPRQQPLNLLKEGMGKDEIFRKTKHVVGVNEVTFNVDEGEIFVVMGLSGSGKSTLIRCVNRLIEPTDGSIYIEDTDITKLNKKELRNIRRQKLAMVFQHFALFPHKTVAYNTAYGLKMRGESDSDQRERALEALSMVGLREWADHYPHNLSGGMQQRVGLARALATNTDILLMDEAFSALDPLIRREMQDELLNLQKDLHKTILFITHDLGEALRVGDRIAIMREGEVVQIGTPQEIVTQPADTYVSDFIADVDSGRVLTAEFIMSPGNPMQLKKNSVQDALRKIEKMDTNAAYVINEKKGVEGIVRYERLRRMHENGEKELIEALRGDFPRAAAHAHLNELYQLSAKGEPIAIIDDKGRFEGVVYPLHIFEALSRHGYAPEPPKPDAAEDHDTPEASPNGKVKAESEVEVSQQEQ